MSTATIPRKRTETRRRLLDAAFELISDEGVGAATIGAVCSRAGFTRGAFYSNFADGEDLLLAVYEDRVQSFLGQASQRAHAGLEASGRGPEAMTGVIEAVVASIPSEPTWFLLHDRVFGRAVGDDAARAACLAIRAAVQARFAEVLDDLLGSAGLEATLPVDELAGQIWAAGAGIMRETWLLGEDAVRARTRRVAGVLLSASTRELAA